MANASMPKDKEQLSSQGLQGCVGILPQHYVASQPRIFQLESSSP